MADTEPIFEVCVRGFFMSEEADVVPAITFFVQRTNSAETDWTKAMEAALRSVVKQIERLPVTQCRPMTKAEAEAYCEAEKARDEDA